MESEGKNKRQSKLKRAKVLQDSLRYPRSLGRIKASQSAKGISQILLEIREESEDWSVYNWTAAAAK